MTGAPMNPTCTCGGPMRSLLADEIEGLGRMLSVGTQTVEVAYGFHCRACRRTVVQPKGHVCALEIKVNYDERKLPTASAP